MKRIKTEPAFYPDDTECTSGQKPMDELWAMEIFKGFKSIYPPELLAPKPDQITSDYPQ